MQEKLKSHIVVCERAHRILLTENRLLAITKKIPGDELIAEKRDLLRQLGESINELKACYQADPRAAAQNRALIEKAQRLVLKTLLLDRENEQLLLKCALVAHHGVTRECQPSGALVRQIYAKTSRPPMRVAVV